MASITKRTYDGKQPDKRPGGRERKPWLVRYWDGAANNGRGRQSERSFRTQREARTFVTSLDSARLATGAYPNLAAGKIMFADYVATWIESLDRAAGTRRDYRSMLHKHIGPTFQGKTLAQVSQDREGVTAFLAGLRQMGLSAASVGKARTVIVGTLTEAVTAGKIPGHRVNGIETRRDAANKPATLIPVTATQLEGLAGGLRPELALTVWLMAGTGLRISECLAVSLADFREGGRVLRVHQQVGRDRITAPLKSRKPGEFRDVVVPGWLWRRVQAHVTAYGTTGYLFMRNGGHVAYPDYHSRFLSAAAKAGLPDYTEHQLRHRFASVLLERGVPITDVARWLGHKDINVTFAIYSHFIPSSWDRAREILETIA